MDRKVMIAIAVAAVVVIGVVAAAIMLSNSKGGAVYYVTIAPQNMRAALASGEVDAYIAWEPYVSDSVVDGVGEVLMWSEEIMPNHPCCVVAVSNAFLELEHGPELTKRFLSAHIEANIWMADAMSDVEGENYSLLLDMATEFTLRSEEVVEASFDHLKFGYEMDEGFQTALEEFTQMYIDTNMTTTERLEERGYDSVSDTWLRINQMTQPTKTYCVGDSGENGHGGSIMVTNALPRMRHNEGWNVIHVAGNAAWLQSYPASWWPNVEWRGY